VSEPGEVWPEVPCGYEELSFGMSCDNAQENDDWRMGVKGELANLGLAVKRMCVYFSVTLTYYCLAFNHWNVQNEVEN